MLLGGGEEVVDDCGVEWGIGDGGQMPVTRQWDSGEQNCGCLEGGTVLTEHC